MRVIEIISKNDAASVLHGDEWWPLEVTAYQPTALSAIDALRLSRLIDKTRAAVVVCHRLRDAMSAISARNITKRCKPRVVMRPSPCSPVPRHVPAEIRQGVDLWLMPSQRMQAAYPLTGERAEVAMPIGEAISAASPSEQAVADAPIRLMAVGDIDGNTDSLKAAIDLVERLGGAANLTICGTGKAQHAMPAVRHSRAIANPADVTWKGNDYQLEAEVTECAAIVQLGVDPVSREIEASAWARKPMINIVKGKDGQLQVEEAAQPIESTEDLRQAIAHAKAMPPRDERVQTYVTTLRSIAE